MEQKLDDRLREFMRRAQAGDRVAYSELLELVIVQVRSFVSGRVPPDSVEDVIQETLITLHKARSTYDPQYPFGPWLYALTNYRIKDLRRSNWRRRRITEAVSHFADKSHSIPETEDLLEALLSLPEQQQQIVALHKVAGFSLQEVADKLMISVDAAKMAASRAYKKLRENFEGKTDGN